MGEPLTAGDLLGFTGGGDRFRHWTGRLVYTAGVKYLADRAGAQWLLDVVASHPGNPLARREPFQVWVLARLPGRVAVLEMNDGNPSRAIPERQTEYTDFPLERVELYFTDHVPKLPGEY